MKKIITIILICVFSHNQLAGLGSAYTDTLRPAAAARVKIQKISKRKVSLFYGQSRNIADKLLEMAIERPNDRRLFIWCVPRTLTERQTAQQFGFTDLVSAQQIAQAVAKELKGRGFKKGVASKPYGKDIKIHTVEFSSEIELAGERLDKITLVTADKYYTDRLYNALEKNNDQEAGQVISRGEAHVLGLQMVIKDENGISALAEELGLGKDEAGDTFISFNERSKRARGWVDIRERLSEIGVNKSISEEYLKPEEQVDSKQVIDNIRELLEHGLWDEAWEEAKSNFFGKDIFDELSKEIATGARAKVFWWIAPGERKTLVEFIKRGDRIRKDLDRLYSKAKKPVKSAAKFEAVQKKSAEKLFTDFTKGMRQFCDEFVNLDNDAWNAVNKEAKKIAIRDRDDIDYSKWPASKAEFILTAGGIKDGLYGQEEKSLSLARDEAARAIVVNFMRAISELYDENSPRYKFLTGEIQPDALESGRLLSGDLLKLLLDIVRRIEVSSVFNRIGFAADEKGHAGSPDYFFLLPRLGYVPFIEQEDFISIVDNQQAYTSVEVIPPAKEYPPAIVIRLNKDAGFGFSEKRTGDYIPEGEDAMLKILLFKGDKVVADERAYRDFIEPVKKPGKGRIVYRLKPGKDGSTLLAKALNEKTARIVMTHILVDIDKFSQALTVAAEKGEVGLEAYENVMTKARNKGPKKILTLYEAMPKLTETTKVEDLIKRMTGHEQGYERSKNLQHLLQALKAISSGLKLWPDNAELKKQKQRISKRIKRVKLDLLISKTEKAISEKSQSDIEEVLAEVEALFLDKGKKATENRMQKAAEGYPDALITWKRLIEAAKSVNRRNKLIESAHAWLDKGNLAKAEERKDAAVEQSGDAEDTQRLNSIIEGRIQKEASRINATLEGLRAGIDSAETIEQMPILSEGFAGIGNAIAMLIPSEDKTRLQELLDGTQGRHRKKISQMNLKTKRAKEKILSTLMQDEYFLDTYTTASKEALSDVERSLSESRQGIDEIPSAAVQDELKAGVARVEEKLHSALKGAPTREQKQEIDRILSELKELDGEISSSLSLAELVDLKKEISERRRGIKNGTWARMSDEQRDKIKQMRKILRDKISVAIFKKQADEAGKDPENIKSSSAGEGSDSYLSDDKDLRNSMRVLGGILKDRPKRVRSLGEMFNFVLENTNILDRFETPEEKYDNLVLLASKFEAEDFDDEWTRYIIQQMYQILLPGEPAVFSETNKLEYIIWKDEKIDLPWEGIYICLTDVRYRKDGRIPATLKFSVFAPIKYPVVRPDREEDSLKGWRYRIRHMPDRKIGRTNVIRSFSRENKGDTIWIGGRGGYAIELKLFKVESEADILYDKGYVCRILVRKPLEGFRPPDPYAENNKSFSAGIAGEIRVLGVIDSQA
ncbi:MAG: hypothetical protein ABH843_06135 [Candidatus Omnitrophota bacterium]